MINNNKEIVCYLDIAALPQLTYHEFNGDDELNLRLTNCCVDLLDAIAFYSKKYDTNNIHFIGQDDYVNGIVENLQTKASTEYGINNLNIEVN